MIAPDLDDTIRGILNHEIIVFYTRNDEINYQREDEKRKTIDWIVEQMSEPRYVNGCKYQLPEYTYTFGLSVWAGIRKAMMAMHPTCEICGIEDAKEVHHIRPRFLKGTDHPRNLVCLCAKCHDEVHSQLDAHITDAIGQSYFMAERVIKKRSGFQMIH